MKIGHTQYEIMSCRRILDANARTFVQVFSPFAAFTLGLLGGLASLRRRSGQAWWFKWNLAAVALALSAAGHAQMPEIGLSINGHKLAAEVASTDPTRTEGLMHRRMLPENRGMLFVFRETALHAMWMMNTHIPLSVAFLDANGVIINIEDMEPQTRDTHPATKPAKYALEVNRGWFKKRGIQPGAKVDGIERAPPAQ